MQSKIKKESFELSDTHTKIMQMQIQLDQVTAENAKLKISNFEEDD